MSSSCGEVKGWCAASQVLCLLVPLVHGEVGDPEEFEVGCGAGLLEELVLVGELLCEFEAERADALVDPLGIVVPLRGRAELGGDDDGEVFGGVEAPLKMAISAELAFDGLGERDEGCRWCLRRATSRKSRPESPKILRISLTRPRLRAVPDIVADLGDDEAEDGQCLLDLEGARAVRASARR